MRILIASSTYVPAMNGQAVFTTNLAEGLVKQGHKVLVVVDSHHGAASQKVVNGVELIELRSVSLNALHSGVYFSSFPGPEMKRLFNIFQPEIVHIQDHYPVCRSAVKLAHKRGIKIVGTNHFIPENLAPYIPLLSKVKPVFNWVLWQWMLDVYKHVDVVSAQSKAAVKLILHQGLHMPVLPISCGIDLDQYRPDPNVDRQNFCERLGIDPQKKIFLFLGRIDGEKCIDLLIRAMKQLSRDDIQLVIAGLGKVEGSLRRMTADMHITQRVKFTGFIQAIDVPGLMNSVDVFVMPSEAELLSISTLEAMACGRPVLLANALALPELVRDGENGYLFKPGDVSNLVLHMNRLADHPEHWEAMGKISREIASAHNLNDTIQKFEVIYSNLATQGFFKDVKGGVITPA